MTPKPIEWRVRLPHYSYTNGYIDDAHLFTFGWDGLRPKGEEPNKPYVLTSHLPGGKRYRYASADECKAGAARLLELFLVRIAA